MSRLTVIMPVHNAAPFIRAAVESVLSQSFRDFEFLIIDDASTDESSSIVQTYKDPRIRLVRNEENLGVARTLNRGLDMARGDYIVRMDSDDISFHQRLARQVWFMDAHERVGVSGSWVQLFGEQPRVTLRAPTGPRVVEAFMLFDNRIFHPSVILRAGSLNRHRLRYDPSFSRTEDYDLWTRVSQHALLDNLPEVLVSVRMHGQSITSTKGEVMREQTKTILARQLLKLGVSANEEELTLHHKIGRGLRMGSRYEIDRAESWLLELQRRNREVRVFDEGAMAAAVGMVWFRLCSNSTPLGVRLWRKYRGSALSCGYRPAVAERLRFFASIAWHTVQGLK